MPTRRSKGREAHASALVLQPGVTWGARGGGRVTLACRGRSRSQAALLRCGSHQHCRLETTLGNLEEAGRGQQWRGKGAAALTAALLRM